VEYGENFGLRVTKCRKVNTESAGDRNAQPKKGTAEKTTAITLESPAKLARQFAEALERTRLRLEQQWEESSVQPRYGAQRTKPGTDVLLPHAARLARA
jgi:hypothetical protein